MDRKLENDKNQLIGKFNDIVICLLNFLGDKYPDSQFGIHKKFVEDFFNTQPKEPISLFIEYVYSVDEYRNNILEGNDSFFLGLNHEEGVDKSIASQIFQFKEFWVSFDEEMKVIIRKTFNLLIKYAESYIMVLNEMLDITKKKTD